MDDKDKIKGAAPDQENAPSEIQQDHLNKETTILTILKSGISLHRFSAERVGDHCLPSTISALKKKGHLFDDEWIWVKTRFNRETHVKLYSYIEGKE